MFVLLLVGGLVSAQSEPREVKSADGSMHLTYQTLLMPGADESQFYWDDGVKPYSSVYSAYIKGNLKVHLKQGLRQLEEQD